MFILEAMGILILLSISLWATVKLVYGYFRKGDRHKLFKDFRFAVFRGILMSLELLVAADIINTVAVNLSLRTVSVLAIIIVIRTFLSFTLELEITGRWPWEKEDAVQKS